MRVDRDLEYYRRQPYGRVFEIRIEGDQRYFLYRIREIPEIAGDGVTKDEALRNLREAFDDYITWALDEGLEIAQPLRGTTAEESGAASRVTRHANGTSTAATEPAVQTTGPETRCLPAVAA